MNPQPPEYIGHIFAFIFISLCVFYFIKGLNDPNNIIKPLDRYTIGYFDEPNYTTINIKNKTVKEVAKKSKPNFESQQLYIDCIDALCAIGMKKTEAKKRAKEIFSTMNNPPASIQDFLMIALKQQ
jgi:hypothetical protein